MWVEKKYRLKVKIIKLFELNIFVYVFSNKVIFVSVYLVGDFLVFKKKFYMYVGFCCWVLYIGYLYVFSFLFIDWNGLDKYYRYIRC